MTLGSSGAQPPRLQEEVSALNAELGFRISRVLTPALRAAVPLASDKSLRISALILLWAPRG